MLGSESYTTPASYTTPPTDYQSTPIGNEADCQGGGYTIDYSTKDSVIEFQLTIVEHDGSEMAVPASQVLRGADGPRLSLSPQSEIFGVLFTVISDCDRWVITDFSLKAVGIVHFIGRVGNDKQFGDSAVRFYY